MLSFSVICQVPCFKIPSSSPILGLIMKTIDTGTKQNKIIVTFHLSISSFTFSVLQVYIFLISTPFSFLLYLFLPFIPLLFLL